MEQEFIRTMEDDDNEEHFETLVYGQSKTDQNTANVKVVV